jgi:TruD family tRNA pseudouridine synthase
MSTMSSPKDPAAENTTEAGDGCSEGDTVLERHFSTIGIEDVFLGAPPHPLLSSYLKEGCSESFPSWELVGIIKKTPEDFCVREIFQTNRRIPGVEDEEMERIRVAALMAQDKLPRQNLENKTPPSEDPNISSPTSPNRSSEISVSASANPGQKDYLVVKKKQDISPSEVIKSYLGKASGGEMETFSQTAQEVIISLGNLQAIANDRIKSIREKEMNSQILQEHKPVWIHPAATSQREERGALHRALKIEYPLLKSEGAQKDEAEASSTDHWIRVKVDTVYDNLIQYLQYPEEDIWSLLLFRNRGFDGAKSANANTNQKGRDEKASQRHRDGRASVNTEDCSEVILRLRPNISKDERRSIHHLIAEKCKFFATSMISDFPLKPRQEPGVNNPNAASMDDSAPSSTVAVVVSWQKRVLQRGNGKRKRPNDNEANDSGPLKYPHVLCILKKRQKEHLTAIQKLTQAVRCRQSDIGLAGIKDMQAVTYQFCTLRNITIGRVQNASRQLQKNGMELGNLYRVDWVLNNGDLEGNQFEITVRNLKRITVQSKESQPAKETLIPCDQAHFGNMVERIRSHGFINFFGEQRIGSPGRTEDVGVRGFDVGRAMLQQKFTLAIDLLMTGRTSENSRESAAAKQVRQTWKDTVGDPSATLKAFKSADIMPRERAVLKGLNRYGKDQPLEALRCLGHSMRMFSINAYQSFIWNQVASKRIQKHGTQVIKGDLYFDSDDMNQDHIKVVDSKNHSVQLSQVVLPLPGYNIRYPENDGGDIYRELLEQDNVVFEKGAPPEATAKGAYRRLIVNPSNLTFEMASEETAKLKFQLPKGCYATMLLRELMLTTATRKENSD